MNATRRLHDLGQSLWLDNITRRPTDLVPTDLAAPPRRRADRRADRPARAALWLPPTSPISFFACGATDGARAFGASGRLLLFLFRFRAFGSGRALALGRSERALMRPGRASNRVGFASTPIDTAPTLLAALTSLVGFPRALDQSARARERDNRGQCQWA